MRPAFSDQSPIGWVLQYFRPLRFRLIGLSMLLLLSKGLGIWNPLVVQNFINAATAKGPLHTLLWIAALFLTIAVVNQLLGVALSYMGNDVAWRATNQLRTDLMRHCLRLDLSFHNERTPGEMIERIDGDISALSNFFSVFVINILGSAILVIGILVVMFRTDPKVGLIMLIFAALTVTVLSVARNFGVSASMAERQASAQFFGFVEERLAGIEDIQANGATEHTLRQFHIRMSDLFHKGRRAWMRRVIPFNLTNGFYTLAVVAVLATGVTLYLHGQISLGKLYLFYQYTQLLSDPLEQLGNQIQDYQKAQSGLRRVMDLWQIEPAVRDANGGELPRGALSVEFRGVTFCYEPDRPALEQIDFRLNPGEVLGIVGRTGSGKTSLSRLLLRLYNVDHGTVSIGGVDIRTVSFEHLYQRVGMVTQDVQLFDASLRDNISLFNPTISDEAILQTLNQLGLTEWVERLPNGLDTHLRVGGHSLSAGEAQLVALTRIFLLKPSLVIMDEPSSRLDPVTESMLQHAVHQLLTGCTGVIIAHRLSTLSRVDKILVLREGRILEFGDRAALATDATSHFGRLLGAELQEELV